MRRTILNKLLIPALIVVASSCTTKRMAALPPVIDPFPAVAAEQPVAPVSSAITPPVAGLTAATLDTLLQRQAKFATLSIKAKGNFRMEDKDNDATLNIRITSGQAIWISVTATLANLEILRAVITPDSLKFINRLEKTVLLKPFAALAGYTGSGISFTTLQALLVGNSIPFTPGTASIEQKNGNVLIHMQLGEIAGLITATPQLEITRTDLKNTVTSQLFNAAYTDRFAESGQVFPHGVNIRLASGAGDFSMNVHYTKVIVDAPVEMPFSVSKKFTLVN